MANTESYLVTHTYITECIAIVRGDSEDGVRHKVEDPNYVFSDGEYEFQDFTADGSQYPDDKTCVVTSINNN